MTQNNSTPGNIPPSQPITYPTIDLTSDEDDDMYKIEAVSPSNSLEHVTRRNEISFNPESYKIEIVSPRAEVEQNNEIATEEVSIQEDAEYIDVGIENNNSAGPSCVKSNAGPSKTRLSGTLRKTKVSKKPLPPPDEDLDPTSDSSDDENATQVLDLSSDEEADNDKIVPAREAENREETMITKTGVVRYRSGIRALKEIRHAQRRTLKCIPRRVFCRLVRDILLDFKDRFKIQILALMALQDAAENHLIRFFETSNYAAIHAKRVTIMPRDFNLVKRIQKK